MSSIGYEKVKSFTKAVMNIRHCSKDTRSKFDHPDNPHLDQSQTHLNMSISAWEELLEQGKSPDEAVQLLTDPDNLTQYGKTASDIEVDLFKRIEKNDNRKMLDGTRYRDTPDWKLRTDVERLQKVYEKDEDGKYIMEDVLDRHGEPVLKKSGKHKQQRKTVKTLDEDGNEVDLYTMQPNDQRRVIMMELNIPLPIEMVDLSPAEQMTYLMKAKEIVMEEYGGEDNLLEGWLHFDEMHQYESAVTGKNERSRPHLHMYIYPEFEGALNCKALFNSKGTDKQGNPVTDHIQIVNNRIDEMTKADYGHGFNTGEKRRGKKQERLKAFSNEKQLEHNEEARKDREKAGEELEEARKDREQAGKELEEAKKTKERTSRLERQLIKERIELQKQLEEAREKNDEVTETLKRAELAENEAKQEAERLRLDQKQAKSEERKARQEQARAKTRQNELESLTDEVRQLLGDEKARELEERKQEILDVTKPSESPPEAPSPVSIPEPETAEKPPEMPSQDDIERWGAAKAMKLQYKLDPEFRAMMAAYEQRQENESQQAKKVPDFLAHRPNNLDTTPNIKDSRGMYKTDEGEQEAPSKQ